MKSKLEQLQEEEKHLVERLNQTVAKQNEIKSQMITNRLHTEGALSRQWAAFGLEIELLQEALTQVHTQVEAELGRINLSALQKGLR